MRLMSLLLLLAVLPTVELVEQVAHVVEHAVHGDAPDHLAHHDDSAGDEHGCTGLIHLCACHHAQVTAAARIVMAVVETRHAIAIDTPVTLFDLNALEPPHRPPIG